MLYNDYLRKVAKRFDDLLGGISAHHNFEFGSEYEVALCRFLREILPQKFGVCRGYVVAADGSQAGDDIIIYDQDRFPTLRLLPIGDFACKQEIPVEALCAYIEAKHSLVLEGDGDQSLHKAFRQVGAVKKLAREPVPRHAPDPYMRPYEEFEKRLQEMCDKSRPNTFALNLPHIDPMPGWPETRNPIFGAVVSRQVRLKTGGVVLTEPEKVGIALRDATLPPKPWPDLVIADKNTVMMPVLDTKEGIGYVSPFLVPACVLDVWQREGLAFVIGMGSLLFALDYIRLGVMPWMDILADSVATKAAKQSEATETTRTKKE